VLRDPVEETMLLSIIEVVDNVAANDDIELTVLESLEAFEVLG
jgi:hypothetical protein